MAVASSVDSFINAQPETILSKDQYWVQNYAGKKSGIMKNAAHYNDWNYNIAKFFGDKTVKKFENEYQTYLDNANNRNEFLASQSARAWDKMMDDTKYQRLMKDLEMAGLNPYLALNNGGISATAAPSSGKPSYKAKGEEQQKTDKGRNMAILLLAVAKIAAALL